MRLSEEPEGFKRIFDTLKGRIFMSEEKFDKTMALLLELMQQAE